MILADEQLILPGQAGTVIWPLTDNLGSVRDLADNSGTVVNHLQYDSFGRVVGESNPSVHHQFGFTGRERDLETRMYYYRARYYDPAAGVFIGVDPTSFAGGDYNLYRYVGNSLTMFTDPSGLRRTPDGFAPPQPPPLMAGSRASLLPEHDRNRAKQDIRDARIAAETFGGLL